MRATGRTVGEASLRELDQAWEGVKSREPGRETGSGSAP